MTDAVYIDTDDALLALCERLRNCSYLAIDTEFLREKTYRPELCLVQIKHQEVLACIDTLVINQLDPLIELLLDDRITKVFHAASQDLEIFYLLCKSVPRPIFDTQLAAPLLGYAEQIGYANLVEQHLNVSLAKTHTRADWKRRPLPESHIDYALDDVIYLEALYLDMHAQLQRLHRLEWLEPEFRQWEDPAKYDQPAGERWRRIRNIHRYRGDTLSAIQHLCRWREIKARELNQPRNWLLKDDVILNIAQQKPQSITELEHIRGLDKKNRDRFGTDLIAVLKQSLDTAPEPLPPIHRKEKLSPGKLARMQLLNALVHHRAEELNIAPGILGPLKLLENVACDDWQSLAGWRESLLREDFEQLLGGQAALACAGERLILLPMPEKD